MEWVEFTAKSVDEAKSLALEQLGVAEEDAEFEILDEPKQGLFGRIRGEARLRARVRPEPVRAKHDRRRPRRDSGETRGTRGKAGNGRTESAETSAGAAEPAVHVAERSAAPASRSPRGSNGASSRTSSTRVDGEPAGGEQSAAEHVGAERVGAEAASFLDGLVRAFGVEAASEVRIDDSDIEVLVTGADLGLLVGPRGTTLQAIQDLARVASQRRLGDQETRLRIDIGGYRERRRQALSQFAEKMAAEVVASGTARVLEPMGSADRKVIHDTLADFDGVETRSEGDDPHRRVVIAVAH